MGIYVMTASHDDATGLLDEMLRDMRTGLLPSWNTNPSGEFTSSFGPCCGTAFFCPVVLNNLIEFRLEWNRSSQLPRSMLYAFYHGQLVEALFSRYVSRFISIQPYPDRTLDTGEEITRAAADEIRRAVSGDAA